MDTDLILHPITLYLKGAKERGKGGAPFSPLHPFPYIYILRREKAHSLPPLLCVLLASKAIMGERARPPIALSLFSPFFKVVRERG